MVEQDETGTRFETGSPEDQVGSREKKRGEPRDAHEDPYPAIPAPRCVLPLTRRTAPKARSSPLGFPAESRVGSTPFTAGGEVGIVRERSCSGATQMTVYSEIGIDRWLVT
jgi:hypothetical protein